MISHSQEDSPAKTPPGRRSFPFSLLRIPLSPRSIQCYRLSDALSGLLIGAMLLFSPWAFGTTQPWSIWTMNVAGYALGLLLAVKLAIRRLAGYEPPNWNGVANGTAARRGRLTPAMLTSVLAVLTGLILLYTFTSAFNASATWRPAALSFEPRAHLGWLPHSLDGGSSWFAFWQYLGLAAAFWAIWDWLQGKAASEEFASRADAGRRSRGGLPFPARLRALLWLLAVNGALLAIEGIVQRLEGSGELLFLVKPKVNPEAITQFGPYAYRSNASQYFNLLWPVCLGFWWTLQRAVGTRRQGHHLLLVCAALMAAAPIISTSRGGALIAAGLAVVATLFLWVARFVFPLGRHENRFSRELASAGTVLFLIGALALGFSLGGEALAPRLTQFAEGYSGREQMFERARPMAADYPLFGTGPGTFENVFQLYRASTETYWPAQLHNDWLETRITFGWAGCGLIALALVTVLARWFLRGGLHGGRRFVALSWMALAGCLVHARYDLPFQIHSILFLFLVICAVLFTLSRRGSAEA